MIRRLLAILVLALALAPPAFAADPEIEDGSAQAALDAARAQWAAQGFGGDYDWWVHPGPLEPILVRGGTGERTVPQLFDRIQQAIVDRVAEFDVSYGERGVPRFVRADGYSASVGAIRAAGYIEAVRAALAAARERWAQSGLRDYDMTVQQSCFCPPVSTQPQAVHVRDGKAVESRGWSVERIFDHIEANADAYKVEATYAADGRPLKVFTDLHPNIADDELQITTSDLRAAFYDPAAQAALDAARARWEREKLANYGYRVRAVCRCPTILTRPYAVHVREGRPVRSHRYIRGLDTVEKLFARIQGAIDSGAYFLRVDYGHRGVPRLIAINAQEYVLDEEIAHVVTRVHPEPGRLPPKIALAILDGTALVELDAARERWRAANRPQRVATRRKFARIATAIADRVRVLDVRYASNGVPTRIRIRPR